MKKRGNRKSGKKADSGIDKIILKEFDSIQQLKKILSSLEKKYKVSSKDILSAIEKEITIPVSIFTKKLTVLESVVEYLKEEKGYSYHQIALLLIRNEKNIWHTYHNAKKKFKESFKIISSKYSIPVSIFQDTRLSVLEAIVVYLKDEVSLSNHQIAVLLKRDDRTIWTVYHNTKHKK